MADTRKTSISLSAELYVRLRVFAAQNGRRIGEVIVTALTEYLDRHEGRK